jgi:ABC-type bacteriocin/lantibiotic exporter with double-glycine peptidase domain
MWMDACGLRGGTQRITLHGVQDVMLLAQSAFAMTVISPHLAAVVLLTVPVGTAVMIGMGAWLGRQRRRANKATLAAQAHAQQVLGGVRTVRAPVPDY